MTLNRIQNEGHAIQEIFSILMPSGVQSNVLVYLTLVLQTFIFIKI